MVKAERMQPFKNGKSRTKGRVNKIHDCYLGNITVGVKVVVVQLLSHVPLCDPMSCSMPGVNVLHYLLEFAQNSCPLSGHPLLSASPPAFTLSQRQDLFQ